MHNRQLSTIFLLCLSDCIFQWRAHANSDDVCKWTYKNGVSFDLTKLIQTNGDPLNTYGIKVGYFSRILSMNS